MLKNINAKRKNLILHYKKRLIAKESLARITMCDGCNAFFYKKSWHFEMPLDNRRYDDVEFSKCPSCVEEENIYFQSQSNLAY